LITLERREAEQSCVCRLVIDLSFCVQPQKPSCVALRVL
jgi:hypothetical protein